MKPIHSRCRTETRAGVAGQNQTMRPPPPRTGSALIRHRGPALHVRTDMDSAESEEEVSRERDTESDRSHGRGFASVALASGTGEDVAALGTRGVRPRFRLEGVAFRSLMVSLAILLLVLWGWLALRLPAQSSLSPGDGPESGDLAEAESLPQDPADEETLDDETKVGAGDPALLPGTRDAGVQDPENTSTQQSTPTIVVYVSGQIHNPGVYDLPGGSRVNNLIDLAGGLSESADATAINLAAPLVDSQHVHVPSPGEQIPPAAVGPEAAGPAVSGPAGANQDGLVDINAAGLEELQALPGIGPALASAIVEWREANGPFASVEDLLDVPGIGDAKLERLRSHATV